VTEAMRRAKLEMVRGELGETYRHPYYWAPLAVFGEGNSLELYYVGPSGPRALIWRS